MKEASQSKKEELICNKTNILHPNDQNQSVEQPVKRQKVDSYDSYWQSVGPMVAVVRKSRLELDKEAAIKMQLERLEEQARLKTHKGLVFKFE